MCLVLPIKYVLDITQTVTCLLAYFEEIFHNHGDFTTVLFL